MINETELVELICFDLETSSEYATFAELQQKNPRKAELWKIKVAKMYAKTKDTLWEDYEAAYETQTALIPEFGRIVCASVCQIVELRLNGSISYSGRIKSFYDTRADETSEKEQILQPFAILLENLTKTAKNYRLCGHNIKKFDVPFLTKRIIINGVYVPPMLQTWGKKPWELTFVDTGELWTLGVWDQYISLDLLTCTLGVPSPKENMKGEYVGAAFWKERNFDKIAKYCEEDVKAVARVCHKWTNSNRELIF